MFAVLRSRNFSLLWFGQIISMIGDWVLVLALPFYIYNLTGSALATGGMFIAMFLPRLFVGTLAGVFVDRWNRRMTMIISDLLRAALLLMLLLVHSANLLWLIFAVAILESAVSQFFAPARSAIIPSLVSEEELVAANSLDAFSDAITRLLGPSLGGMLFGLLGIVSIVLLDSASYIVSAILILLIVVPARSAASQPVAEAIPAKPAGMLSIWHELLAGLRLVGNDRTLTILFLGTSVMMISNGILQVMLVVFTKEILHGDAAVLGWFMTAQGVGALVGSLLLGKVSKMLPPKYLLLGAFALLGVIIIAIVNIPVLWLDMVLIAIAGLGATAFMICSQTLLQNGVSDEFRGRVFGAYETSIALLMLLGMGFASMAASWLGTVPILTIAGLITLFSAFFFLFMPNTAIAQPALVEEAVVREEVKVRA